MYIYYNYTEKPLFIKTKNYIDFLIEKTIVISIISITAVIIGNYFKISNYMNEFIFVLVLVNLYLWINIFKYQKYEDKLEDVANVLRSIESFDFDSSKNQVKNYKYNYLTEKDRKDVESQNIKIPLEGADQLFFNQPITNFKPIVLYNDIELEQDNIKETTIDLALNSDDMFYFKEC